MKYFFIILVIICVFNITSCKKDAKITPNEPEVVVPEKQDSIYFIFVNRAGYKNDSIKVNDTIRYLYGIVIRSLYYNVKTNITSIYSNSYGRNNSDPALLLKDSMVHIVAPAYINSQYSIKVELIWINQFRQYVRDVGFQLNANGGGNDTIKTKGTKLVKFIWPDDTSSSKFFKAYDVRH